MPNYYIDKEVKVYLENSEGLVWQIPVTSAPLFAQETTLNSAPLNTLPAGRFNRSDKTDNVKVRVSKIFKTGYEPAQWSFATHIRPYTDSLTTQEKAVEDVLWSHFLSGKNEPNYQLTTEYSILPTKSSSPTSFTLHFIYANGEGYKILGALVDSADITVSMDTVGTINWSGVGTELTSSNGLDLTTIQNSSGIDLTDNYIINKMSEIEFKSLTQVTETYPIYHVNLSINSEAFAVSLDGDYAVIGSFSDDTFASNSGSAQVIKALDVSGTLSWTFFAIANLVDPNQQVAGYFGYGCDISGDYVAVGAPGYLSEQGIAYIYKRTSGNSWLLHKTIEASDKSTSARFGNAIAISGTKMIVSASYETLGGITRAGSAYIYETSDDWATYDETKLDINDTTQAGPYVLNDYFGYSVDIQGDVVVTGGHGLGNDGYAFIFVKINNAWVQQQELNVNPDYNESAEFGRYAELSMPLLIIGSPRFDEEKGAGFIYKTYDGGLTWELKTVLHDSSMEQFPSTGDYNAWGLDIDIDSEGKAIAVVGTSGSHTKGSSTTYVSIDYGETWKFNKKLLQPSTEAASENSFGSACAVDNGRLLVGAWNTESSTGITVGGYYTYEISITEESALDLFSFSNSITITDLSVSMSNSMTPILAPLLGEPDHPIGFSLGELKVSGSFSGYLFGGENEDYTKKLVNLIRESNSTQRSGISLNIGGSSSINRLKIDIPQCYIDDPSIESAGISKFTSGFLAEETSLLKTDNDNNIVTVSYKSKNIS